MQITFVPLSLAGEGAIALGISEGAALSGQAAEADRLSGGALKRAMAVSRFKGKPGQILELIAPSGLKASRLLLAGQGKAEKFDATAAERSLALENDRQNIAPTFAGFRLSEAACQALRDLLTLCREERIDPVLVLMPPLSWSICEAAGNGRPLAF